MSASGARGFAGLATLVSDVTADIAEAERLGRLRQTPPAPAVAPTSAVPVVRAPLGGMSTTAKVALALGAVFVIAWLIGTLTNQPSAPQAAAPSAPSQSESSTSTPLPSTSTPQVPAAPTPSSPAQVAPTSPPPAWLVPSEVKPPVGRGLLLDTSQIRYCLAEKIRIKAISPLVNNESAQEVDRFNLRVDDYNSRCGSFKYRGDTLDRARADIEAQRATIENLARVQWEAEK